MKKISEEILDSAIKIHRALGPGLLESVYQNCLLYELEKKGITCQKEIILPVKYEELSFDSGFRADLIAKDKVIIEIKSLERLNNIHRAQILTYLKLSCYPLGLLINFGTDKLVNGFHRFANGAEANEL
ncbi:MAG: GxxExxY protein [Rhodospirillales bacterium]|nr:GxxExxY protein [Rhodospirillales bacterium]MCB9979591.1 GxxExxY protein [Rhodospirillales bacterium]